jgi:hypothetical protein
MSRRPKSSDKPPELKEQAGQYAGEAVLALVTLMRTSSSDPVRVAAARELLDRAHGKPRAEAGAGEGQSLQEMVRAAFEREDP